MADLKQQCVLILRPTDQFMVMQNGQQKLMLVSAFTDALKELAAGVTVDTVGSMAVAAHTHPESDITNLSTDLASLTAQLLGKAAVNHTHLTYIDGTTLPATQYFGAYAVTRKGTVAAGNLLVHFTDDGLATGNALFPNGPIPNSELFRAEEGNVIAAAAAHIYGQAVWSNGNKTLTIPVAKTGAGIAVALLGLTLLGQNVAANGSVIYVTAYGK